MNRIMNRFHGIAPVLGLALLAPMLAAMLATVGCAGKESAARPAAPPMPPRTVVTAAVERAGGGTIAVPATVAARQSATLAARIPAAVRELPRREGEPVAAGAVVVRLEDSALRSAVTAAEAGLQAAASDLARMEGLAKAGAATPREVEEASARAAAARAAVSGARDNLSYAVLRSPFSGVIAARRVEVGDVVSPGQPLVEIEGAGGLELRATLSAEESLGLRPGAEMEARVDGIAAPLRARISALSPAGDPATHRFELRADLPAASGLRSGLFARLLLPVAAGVWNGGEETLTVPSAAVFQRGGLTGVFVATDEEGRGQVARLRWIAPGASAGDRIEIRAGLDPGERVVLAPGDLADGTPLTVQEQAEEAR